MTPRMTSSALLLVLAAGAAAGGASGLGPLSAAAGQGPFTAVLGGRVVAGDAGGLPVAGAWVTVRGDRPSDGRTTLSDDDGRFVFRELPAGRYTIGASKAAYVNTEFGAARPGRRGTPVVLAADEQRTDLELQLWKGGVITGTVRDAAGEPVRSMALALFRRRFVNGERTLEAVQTPGRIRESFLTDERGVYRIFGLAPGEYYVAADPPRIGASAAVREMMAADIERAEQLLAGGSPRPLVMPVAPGADAPGPAPTRTVAFSRVYYPGTTNPAVAAPILLAAGEERTGVDVRLELVPTAQVEGMVLGLPAPGAGEEVVLNVSLRSIEFSGVGASAGGRGGPAGDVGRFTFPSVAPGRYRIEARAYVRSQTEPARGVPANPTLRGRTDVEVRGQNLTGLSVVLERGVTLRGRVDVVSSSGDTPTIVGVVLMPPDGDLLTRASASVQPDRTFVVEAVPGRYQVSVATADAGLGRVTRWGLDAVSFDGRPVAHEMLDVGGAPPGEILIRLTDRPTELSGLLSDAAGRPAPEFFIVVFPEDRRGWVWESSRIQAARPGTDGRYVVSGLPPGDYLLAALTDVEDKEWFDPDLLQQLVAGAIRVSLASGERRSQDIRIR